MAESFLVLVKEAIDEAKNLTSDENDQLLKLNKLQCKCVAEKLLDCQEVLQSAEFFIFPAAFQQCDATLSKELYRVVMDALGLIKDCCDEQCLKAAISQTGIDKKEYFARAIYEVEWCTSTLYSLCLRENDIPGKESTTFLEPERCDGKLGVFDFFKLERAAQKDRENLRSQLELRTQDHIFDADKESCLRASTEGSCLAAQSTQSLNSGLSAATNHPATISMSRNSIWKVYVPYIPKATSLGRGSFELVHETEWLREQQATKVFPHRVEDKNFNTASDVPSDDLNTHPHEITTISCKDDHKKARDHNCSPLDCLDIIYEDLDQFLRKRSELMHVGPLSIPASVDLMLQIAQGVKSLHNRGIAHSDLKLSNILLKPLAGTVPELEYMEGYIIAKVAHFGEAETKNWVTSKLHSDEEPDESGTLQTTVAQFTEMAMMEDEMSNNDNFFTTTSLPKGEAKDPLKTNDVYDFATICYEIMMTGEDSMPSNVHWRRGEAFKSRSDDDDDADALEPELPERCPRRLAFLLQRCWEKDPSERPDFNKICKELRYIKGLLLTGDQHQLQKVDLQLHTMKLIEKAQGPWGGHGGSPFHDGYKTGIKKLKISFTTESHVIWGLQVEYDERGQVVQCTHGGLNHGTQRQIKFDYPNEYLQQIEGYYGVTPAVHFSGMQVTTLTSITFKSNKKTYGPYGVHGKGHKRFKSGIGTVVGFFGRSGMCLDQIGVLNDIS